MTPINQESFTVWKAKRLATKATQDKIEMEKLVNSRLKAGALTGKELFQLNPEAFGASAADEEDAWEGEYKNREDSDNEENGEQNTVRLSYKASLVANLLKDNIQVDTPLDLSVDMLEALPNA